MLTNPNDNTIFDKDSLKTIYLAGGCFWGVDAYLKRIKGVYETESGYANGHTANPTYEEVKAELTGHAETVKVVYDCSKLSLTALLDEFFDITDPTTLNRQAEDRGIQYRSGIYYTDDACRDFIENFVQNKQKNYKDPIVLEILPLDNYYRAEEYHQDYLEKNPDGYCHVDLSKYKP